MFRITGGKGFHIEFENGWTVSVQFGPGNYCDNYDRRIGEEAEQCGKEGSNTAECAAWGANGDMVTLPDFMDSSDTVSNRSSAAQVLQLLNWASTQAPVS